MGATPGPGPPFAGGAEAATGVSAAAAVAASAPPTGAFAAAVGFRSSLLPSVMAAICFGSMRVNNGLYGRLAWSSSGASTLLHFPRGASMTDRRPGRGTGFDAWLIHRV